MNGVTFGSMLAQFRTDRQISQSKLAGLCDLTPSFVSRLESDARWPTRESVERLANALRLPPSTRAEFVAAAGYMPAGSGVVGTAILVEIDSLLNDETVQPSIRAIVVEQLKTNLRLLTVSRKELDPAPRNTSNDTSFRNGDRVNHLKYQCDPEGAM